LKLASDVVGDSIALFSDNLLVGVGIASMIAVVPRQSPRSIEQGQAARAIDFKLKRADLNK
jgi:hypothetical protein